MNVELTLCVGWVYGVEWLLNQCNIQLNITERLFHLLKRFLVPKSHFRIFCPMTFRMFKIVLSVSKKTYFTKCLLKSFFPCNVTLILFVSSKLVVKFNSCKTNTYNVRLFFLLGKSLK